MPPCERKQQEAGHDREGELSEEEVWDAVESFGSKLKGGKQAAAKEERFAEVEGNHEAMESCISPLVIDIHRASSASRHTGVEVLRSSAPMKVPDWPKGSSLKDRAALILREDLEDEEYVFGHGHVDNNFIGLRLPPHLIVARQHSRQQAAAFSVMEGAGRTLKGRDLRNVRNAVWRSTGFFG